MILSSCLYDRIALFHKRLRIQTNKNTFELELLPETCHSIQKKSPTSKHLGDQ